MSSSGGKISKFELDEIAFMNNNGLAFRLRRIQISGHPVLKDLDITLCDDDSVSSSIYTTGIIGENGTGKSHLMGAIASAFSEICRTVDSDISGRKNFSFTVEYDCAGRRYLVSNVKRYGTIRGTDIYIDERNYLWATCDGEQINLEKIVLPARVIASTMTITDKFVAKSDSFYRYKGIRNERSASTTGTRTIIRKTVESLMNCMVSKDTFQSELRILLRNLGLEEHLRVSYGMRYKDLFLQPNMSAARIREIFDNWKKCFPVRESEPWGYKNYIRGLRDNDRALSAAARFLSDKARKYDSFSSVVVSYDVMQAPGAFHADAEALRVLTQLDLVSFPSINVVKRGTPFGFENSSSGETHLLCQFIGIMADICHDSLILIDEPENSSHPDWQMNYVGWLKDIFSKYSDCHFIIATHSPLILANMKTLESKIVRLRRDEDNRISDEGGMEKGCYSWTVDEILQDVMEMKKENTDDYERAIKRFELAVRNNDRKAADISFKELEQMINPKNELLELLKIQKAAIDDD